MTDFLSRYLKEINIKLKQHFMHDWRKVLDNHREMIKFMQHERLIHLMVTLTFGILFVTSMIFTLSNSFLLLIVVDFLLGILLVPYIFHYFKLENGVQKMYWIDKLIQKRLED